MAFDCVQQRKPLYADLFKTHKKTDRQSTAVTTPSWSSSSGSSWNQSLLSCDSSSSGFSTPLYSDLGSSESDEGDFIAELTRQMAECMLQDEDEESTDRNCVTEDCQASSQVKKNSQINRGSNCSAVGADDQVPPPQVYELKSQPPPPPVSKRCRRRRAKAADSAQLPKKAQPQKTEQRHLTQYAGREWRIAPGINGHTGSGMQAVFLSGSVPGSRSGTAGTGVFLPRVTGDPVEIRKKSGCPMVLIPTRVLQVLEGHFNRVQDSTGDHGCPSSPSPTDEYCGVQVEEDGQSHEEVGEEIKISGNNYEAEIMQLPKEWIY